MRRLPLLALPAALFLAIVATAACGDPPSIEGPPLLSETRPKKKKGSSTSTSSSSGESSEEEDRPGEADIPRRPQSNELPGETGSNSSSTSSSTSGSGGTTPSTTDAGTPPQTATGECAPSTTKSACFTCCETAHPAGIQFLWQAFGDCACNPNAAGNCVAVCGDNWCVGTQQTAACEQCLDTTTQCGATADAACLNNTNCKALLTCDSASACETKP